MNRLQAGSLLALFYVASLPAVLAQSTAETAGIAINAKLSPRKALGFVPLSADILELEFLVDQKAKNFGSITYECELLNKHGKVELSQRGGVSRADFAETANGQLIYRRRGSDLPGGGLTEARCRITELKK